jgi:hypothetical protein
MPNATVIAAMIAGFVALAGSAVTYIGLLISKESKTSEFRQEWIDALRNDIAEQIGQLVILGERRQISDSERHPLSLSIATTRARILLRMNMAEPESKSVREALDKVHQAALDVGAEPHIGEAAREEHEQRMLLALNRANQVAINASQVLLKKEWDRVKLGEPVYWKTQRYVKRLLIALGCAGAIKIVMGFCLWCYRLLVPPAISALSR